MKRNYRLEAEVLKGQLDLLKETHARAEAASNREILRLREEVAKERRDWLALADDFERAVKLRALEMAIAKHITLWQANGRTKNLTNAIRFLEQLIAMEETKKAPGD